MGRDKMDESKAKGRGLGEGYGRRGNDFEKLKSCSHTVWVPTAFQKRVFVEGGVEAERIQVHSTYATVSFCLSLVVSSPLVVILSADFGTAFFRFLWPLASIHSSLPAYRW